MDYTHVLELETIKTKMMTHCSFSMGKTIISELKPSYNRLYIDRELKRGKEAYDLVIKYGSLPFDGIRDIRNGLEIAKKDGIVLSQDLLAIASHGRVCLSMQDFLKKAEVKVEQLLDLSASFDFSIPLSQQIEKCFNSSGELLDSASPKLKSLRKSLRDTEMNVMSMANKYIQSNSMKISENITTVRNERVVVLVKISEKNSVGGIIHGESSSGQTAYVEPECLVALNNQKRSILSEIEDEIERILFELSQLVKQWADAYHANLETLALLDSYNAKGQWAKEYDGVFATITSSKSFLLKHARHPLIDKKTVVSNTYSMPQDKHLLLIAGPNTGGKTVSLKVIGLSVLMTYCGMAVACEEAMIPLYDQVYVDIGDEQSIIHSLSTFSSHLTRLSSICENATSDSLVLLDELGGGTDPNEGEPFAVAILDYLRQIKCRCVATTHYSSLKAYGKTHEDILLASVAFDVEHMRPTYKYVEGLAGQSNAIAIAQKYGIKKSIIEQALVLKEASKTKEEKLMEVLEKEVLENKALQEKLDQTLLSIKEKEEALILQDQMFNKQKEKMLQEAEEKAQAYLDSLLNEADVIIQQMKEVQKEGQYHKGIALKKQIEQLVEIEENDEEIYHIQEKDYVSIKGTNQRGTVERIDKKKAICNVNGMKITVKVQDLKPAVAPVKKQEKSSYKVDTPTSVKLEINLLGKRVDEALPLIDKYIDDLVLMRAPSARIIHGNGTGALRQAVTQHLKNHKMVSDYRLGGMGEGGLGVTVITLGKKS